MDNTEKTLENETKKWLKKLEGRLLVPIKETPEVNEQITNIKAYQSDCKHFLEKGDLVRAFEAIIYAWGILETLERLGLLKDIPKD